MPEKTIKKLDFVVKVLYITVLIGLGYLAFKFLGLILPFLLALGLVAIFQPLINFMYRKYKIHRKFSAIVLMLLLYTSISSLIYWIVMRMVTFLKYFFAGFPDYYYAYIAPNVVGFGYWLEDKLGAMPDEIQFGLTDAIQNFVSSIPGWGVGIMTGFANSIPSFLISLLFMILLSFFISFDYERLIGFLKNQLPPKATQLAGRLKKLSQNTFLRYVRAYAIIMVITFVILSISFIIIGISNPIGIAAAIAIFDFLPVLGAGSVLFVWVIVELLQGGFALAIGLGVIWGIIAIIRNVIEPKIVGDSLGINPILALLSVFVGYKLFGLLGMILFPMLAQILIVLHQSGTIKLYKEK